MDEQTQRFCYICRVCGAVNDWGTRAARPDPTCGECDSPHSCYEVIEPERWKPIPDQPYDVSDRGRVARRLEDGTRRILKTQIHSKQGHRFVVLHNAGIYTTVNVRSLVAQAFLPQPKPQEHLQFKDGDKGNCSASNLFWKPKSKIIADSYRAGTRKRPSKHTILTPEIYEQIKTLWSTNKFSQVQLGQMYGISNSTVSKIVRGLQSPHTRKYVPTFIPPQVFEDAIRLAATPRTCTTGPGPLGRGLARAQEIMRQNPSISIRGLARAMGLSFHGAQNHHRRIRRATTPGATDVHQHQERSGDSPPTGQPRTGPTMAPLERPSGPVDSAGRTDVGD